MNSRTTGDRGVEYPATHKNGGSRPTDGWRNNLNDKRDPNAGRIDPNEPSGQVRFDDRGNAVWDTWRGGRLEHPALQLADGQPSRDGHTDNPIGLASGYNPYESGILGGKDRPRKKDLRALSKWIEQKKGRRD